MYSLIENNKKNDLNTTLVKVNRIDTNIKAQKYQAFKYNSC